MGGRGEGEMRTPFWFSKSYLKFSLIHVLFLLFFCFLFFFVFFFVL